jgi:hypothetical protein
MIIYFKVFFLRIIINYYIVNNARLFYLPNQTPLLAKIGVRNPEAYSPIDVPPAGMSFIL